MPESTSSQEQQENTDPSIKAKIDDDETPKKQAITPAPKSSGLKRAGATRSGSSPLKAGVKKPFREALKDAFRGQSGGHKLPPMVYPSCKDDPESEYTTEDDDSERTETQPHPSGQRRSLSPDSSSYISSTVDSAATESTFPKRRPPPTRGAHELSTIVSMDSFSTGTSDTRSTLTESTVTQSTNLTKSSGLSRQKSNKSGLKRRLTKHSDLVSVLSLPEDNQLPARTASIKRAASLHRKTSKLQNASLDDLLKEFAEDENLYSRELKTVVDGVIPVLLTQVVHGVPGRGSDLFTPGSDGAKVDGLAKAVVNMGIALEKLRNYHRRVPLHDPERLLDWLESVYPVYNDYLDVWRIGFEDVVVNLTPAGGKPDDEDSLVNAMARNEDGDVLDENGQRVDVAHLLKRPLVRIKWMLKFAKVRQRSLFFL